MRRRQPLLVRHVFHVLAGVVCIAGFSGCEVQQVRAPVAVRAVPAGVAPVRVAGTARVASTAKSAVATSALARKAGTAAPVVVVAAASRQPSHGETWQSMPGAIYANQQKAPVVVVAAVPALAAPKAALSLNAVAPAPAVAVATVQTVSLKPQQLDQDNHVGASYPFGDVEAEAVRYAGGRCSTDIYRLAWAAADLFRVQPEFVAALIEIESGCRSDAVSVAGARGLMQLVPTSGAREGYRFMHGTDRKPTLAELRDPATNIQLGVAYLGALQDHFSYVDAPMTRLLLVIAAYNCGPDFIDQRLPAEAQGWGAEQAAHWVRHSTPLETRAFVDAVMEKAALYSNAALSARTRTVASSRSLSP